MSAKPSPTSPGEDAEMPAKPKLTEVQRAMLGWVQASSPIGLTEEALAEKAQRFVQQAPATTFNQIRQLVALKLVTMEGERLVITPAGAEEL